MTSFSPSFTVRPTPDDGRRLRTESTLDESTRPIGPDPDPERVYSPAELASAQRLIDIHDHLRGELEQIRDLVTQVTEGVVEVGSARQQINAVALRSNRWTVGAHCAGYCYLLTTHHALEDQAVFPDLRRIDNRLGPVLDRLAEEHQIIHDVLGRLDAALVDFVAGRGHSAVRLVLDQLSDALLSHLSYEERELAEPLARAHVLG